MSDELWERAWGKTALRKQKEMWLINSCRNSKARCHSLWWSAELFFLYFNFTPLSHPSFSTPSCPLLAVIIALNHTCQWHSQPWQLGRSSFCEIILQTFGCLSKEPQQESGIICLGMRHPRSGPGSFGRIWRKMLNYFTIASECKPQKSPRFQYHLK